MGESIPTTDARDVYEGTFDPPDPQPYEDSIEAELAELEVEAGS